LKEKDMSSPLTERFAEFIVETHYEDLPPEVIEQAKRCILDYLGAALAGSELGLAPMMTGLILASGGEEEATVIGLNRKVPVLNAALLNGVRGHTLDMDDGHRYANAHPGVVVTPAALALAERENATIKDLIESMVVGYETMIRIARVMNPSHLRKGFHSTGTVGPFGAAAACGKLLGLSKSQMENGLSIAGLQGSGLLQVLDSGQMMKPLHPARAAQSGVLSALLAQRGAEGPEEILEGAKGYFRAYSDKVNGAQLLEGLGTTFEILGVYFKGHAACRHVHPTLDALMEIVNTYSVGLKEIERIEVGTYPVAYSLTGRHQEGTSELAAKFSIPVSVALMLIHGKAGVDEFSAEHLQDPALRSIAGRVHVTPDEWREEVYPAQRGAEVRVFTPRGIFQGEVVIPKGDPENPFSSDELREKFRGNAGKVLSRDGVSRLENLVMEGRPSDFMREIMLLTCPSQLRI
jgi:2-methylcitrate dehydratase PrpD